MLRTIDMAFRIHDSVIRGEIDNRVKGIVRGKVWLEGRTEPIVLELKGNAWPDLAGCLLTFTNPKKPIPHYRLGGINPLQRGTIGDLTASRKVRVFDVPLEEAMEMYRRKEKPPEHMANSIYLEWFSEANGRVVIESADCEVTITPPLWRLTPEEEKERAELAANAMVEFTQRLTEAIQQQHSREKDPEEPWDEHDYEQFFRTSDMRTDKYGELLDKYGHSDEAHEKIAREMGWVRDNMTEEEREEEQRRIDEMNAACEAALNEPEPDLDPAREGIDWMRDETGEIHHPLQHRCFESALKFTRLVDKIGRKKSEDADLTQFLGEFQTTGAKLAGALNPIARDEPFPDAAFTVAYLKRALDHLHKSQTGLEAIAAKKLLPKSTVAEARKELFEIREGILRLMDELRGR